MKKILFPFWAILFISLSNLHGQGTGALAITNLQQSNLLRSAGQIGAAIPNDDVLGYYFNPAILGYSSRNNHASISFTPNKTNWFNNPTPTFNNFGINLGLNLKSTDLQLPISIGVGYLHYKIDYGTDIIRTLENPKGIGNVNSYDLFNSFSLGLGIDYYVNISMGISFKSFVSKLPNIVEGKGATYSADGTMLDYGTLLTLQISKLWMKNTKFQLDSNTYFKPTTNFSVGYSVSNIGDEIYYVDPAQKDPLSRTERLGYTFDLGLDLSLNHTIINFFNYSFTAEAENSLIGLTDDSIWRYENIFENLDLTKNLIKLEYDDEVIVHKGHILKFFDTITFTLGNYKGQSLQKSIITNGLGFSTDGLFKLIGAFSDNKAINYITNHFAVEYFDSNVNFWENTNTNFDGLSIHFSGFEI